MRFFRMTEGIIPCEGNEELRDTLIYLPSLASTIERGLKVPIGCILDTTEFVVELVRLADDAVLAVLDSFGILPNPDSPYPARYGTDPLVRTVVRPLPSSSWGESVYLRISPRRYGPTPLDLTLRKYSSGLCLSLLYPNDDTLAYYPRHMERSFNGTGRDRLDTLRNQSIFAAIESQARQYNRCVFYIPMFTSFSAEEDSLLYHTAIEYMRTRGYIYEGDTQLPESMLSPCRQQRTAAWSWYYSTFNDDTTPSAIRSVVSSLYPSTIGSKPLLKVTNPRITSQPLVIISPVDIGPATLRIYDTCGKVVLATTTNLFAGASGFSHALPPGVYRLAVESPKLEWKWYLSVVVSP